MAKKQNKNKKHNNIGNKEKVEKVKDNTILCEAKVVEVLPNALFKVLLKDFDTVIDATPSGRIRMNHIRILQGDLVTVELSTYDLTKGRITFRHKINKLPTTNNE